MKNKYFEEILKSRLIPVPREVQFDDGVCEITGSLDVEINISEEDPAAAEWIGNRFVRFWDAAPRIRLQTKKEMESFAPEEYEIKISEKALVISARTRTGVFHALKTLRQLAEAKRGTRKTECYVLQPGTIRDRPALDFRAVHICIFPETPMTHVEKQIRFAASLKFNYVIIESWGVFPFRSHPEFAWKDKVKSRKEFEHLLEVAEECGIRLFPQFNIFGHAAMSREWTAKHAVLDFSRELEPLFEPDGWSFCLSNPETKKVLLDLITELHDFYGRPGFFHIGCDEAYDYRTCRACAEQDSVQLLADHIRFFHDRLAEMGARSIMWHDMLLRKDDPRWEGCVRNGEERAEEILKSLPKDILIADWQYGAPPSSENEMKEFPTSIFFQQEGFDVVVCPWMYFEGTAALGQMAVRRKMKGMIATTWHKTYSANHFWRMYMDTACFSWCEQDLPWSETWQMRTLYMAAHLRRIGYDMNIRHYEEAGHTALQIPEKTVAE